MSMNWIENTLACERLYIRKDSFGRIVLDTCPTDAYHLQHSETDSDENRPKCRILAEEMFNESVGKHGWLEVEVRFQPCDPEEQVGALPVVEMTYEPDEQYIAHPAVDDVYMSPIGKEYTVVEIGQKTGRVYITEVGGEDFRQEMPVSFSDTFDTFYTRMRV